MNVLRWYGSLTDYPDLAVIETGHFDLTDRYDDQWGKTVSGPGGGINVQFDEAGRWGTGGLYFNGRSDDSDPGSLHRSFLASSVSILYARNFVGVSGAVMYRHTADTEFRSGDQLALPFSSTFERSREDIGLGARFDVSEKAYLDVAGDIRYLSERASGSATPDITWDTGPLGSWDNFGLRARAFVALNDRVALVPLLEYISEDFTGTTFAGAGLLGETSDNQGQMVRFGAGLDFFPDTDNFLLFSLEYLDGQVDHAINDLAGDLDAAWQEDYSVFLMRLAFESHLAHWVTVRASAGYESLDNRGDVDQPESDEHIPLGLGIGLHTGSVVLDLGLTDREPQGLSRFSAALAGVESSTWLSITLGYGF